MDGAISSERLKTLRYAKKLSQGQLAQLSGISRQTIQRLELNPQDWERVTGKSLSLLSMALGVSKDYFTNDEGDFIMSNEIDDRSFLRSTGKQDATIDLNKLLAVIGSQQSAKEYQDDQLDPVKPITDRLDLPKPAHKNESWQQQTLCFLEGQRRAYMRWLDYEGTLEDLKNEMDKEASNFANLHNVESELDSEDLYEIPVIDRKTKLYQYRTLGGIKEVGTGADLNPDSEITMITPHDYVDGDDVFDLIEIDGKDEYLIRCQHENALDSVDPDEHPFRLWEKQKGEDKKKTSKKKPAMQKKQGEQQKQTESGESWLSKILP